MTLLVAGIARQSIWMVADAAISGGNLPLREREYQIKILPGRDGRTLVGFSGEQHHGTRMLEIAAALPAGPDSVTQVLTYHKENLTVDLAYGYIDDTGPHLHRFSGGKARELTTCHIGLPKAFARFQLIRHDQQIDAEPETVRLFMCGVKQDGVDVPNQLRLAIRSMLRLINEYGQHDVGGWATPYLLTPTGPLLCTYAYSVTDPILGRVAPGSTLPFGTPQSGGFAISVTEFASGGLVVYWLQRPGGIVFRRGSEGFDVFEFVGSPSVFKAKAGHALGKELDLWFSDTHRPEIGRATVVLNEKGKPSMVMMGGQKGLAFGALNTKTPFKFSLKKDLTRK